MAMGTRISNVPTVAKLADELLPTLDQVEFAAGSGRLGDGRSTAGDGTSNPGVNCTCCCN